MSGAFPAAISMTMPTTCRLELVEAFVELFEYVSGEGRLP